MTPVAAYLPPQLGLKVYAPHLVVVGLDADCTTIKVGVSRYPLSHVHISYYP